MNIFQKFETENNCFGTTTWTMEDLEYALEDEGVPATKENLSELYDAIQYDMEDFQDAIGKAGFDYFRRVIRDLAECGDLETH